MLKGIWDAYVWSSQLVLHALSLWAILKIGLAIQSFTQPDPASSNHSPTSHRGKTQFVLRLPTFPLFHPNAHQNAPNASPALRLILWCLDNLLAPTVDAAVSILSKGTSLVRCIKQACQIFAVNSVMKPLGTRLNRGIAQLASRPAFIPGTAYQTAFRYFRPVSFLLCIFAVLVVVVGVSLELVALCFGSLLIVATVNIGTTKDCEVNDDGLPDSTPDMANAGLIGVLLQTEES